jgi:Zn-dependent alcohol dehydrogenase
MFSESRLSFEKWPSALNPLDDINLGFDLLADRRLARQVIDILRS